MHVWFTIFTVYVYHSLVEKGPLGSAPCLGLNGGEGGGVGPTFKLSILSTTNKALKVMQMVHDIDRDIHEHSMFLPKVHTV